MTTIKGLLSAPVFKFSVGFKYVCLREIQSDRLEGEFSLYRQSTGANSFMVANDVLAAFKKRMAKFSASFLNVMETTLVSPPQAHQCKVLKFEDGVEIERLYEVSLTPLEEFSAAYVAVWLEKKSAGLFLRKENQGNG